MKRQEKATIWEARQCYDRDNQEAAALILRDPERYPLGSAMHMWAELVVKKASNDIR